MSMMREGTSCCFDRSRKTNDDDDDDGGDAMSDRESCVSGNTSGPLKITDFPPFMTDDKRIIGNSRMFLWKQNPDQSGFLSSINTNPELYMNDIDSLACLRKNKYTLDIFLSSHAGESSTSI